MTPKEVNEMLVEANRNADKAIRSAKRTIAWVNNMEIVDEATVHSYFRNRPVCGSVDDKISTD